VAFVLILVAISKPGSDMLYKTSQRIENAWKRGQTVNVKVDDFGNTITNDDDEDGSEDEDVIAESLCEPTKMLYAGINACFHG